MLRVYLPEEYESDQKALHSVTAFGLDAKGGVPDGKVVWAVADKTALETDPVDYREYDWSQVDSLCFGADDEILIDSGKIKPEHDVVTIPGLAWSLYMHQAIAVLLSHYITVCPSEERDARVQELYARKWALKERSNADHI